MKIAYIVPSLANKGPIIVVKELVEQMVLNGHSCTVLYFDDIIELDFDCEIKRISFPEKINFLKFDIIHSHGFRPDWYLFKTKKEKNGKTTFISTLHNYIFRDLYYQYNVLVSIFFGVLWLIILRKQDKIITLSQDALTYYKKFLPYEKLTYAYNTRNIDTSKSLSTEEHKELKDFKGNKILIGVNALLTRRKGVDVLIKCLVQLPNHRLFILGDGKERKKLEKLATKLNVRNQCFFAGYRKDGYRYIPFYDIFALPSRSEGFPLSLLEAAFLGKTSIASNLPIIKETFTKDEIFFIDIKQMESVTKSIILASEPNNKGLAIKEKFDKQYSPIQFYKRHIKIYYGKI